MILLDRKVEEAIKDGLVKQVILADGDGFVLDNRGYVFDPDELAALFMATQRQIQHGSIRFDFGQVSEFNFTLVGHEITVACRRVFGQNAGCLVIVVVPAGASHNLIMSEVIRAYMKYVESQPGLT